MNNNTSIWISTTEHEDIYGYESFEQAIYKLGEKDYDCNPIIKEKFFNNGKLSGDYVYAHLVNNITFPIEILKEIQYGDFLFPNLLIGKTNTDKEVINLIENAYIMFMFIRRQFSELEYLYEFVTVHQDHDYYVLKHINRFC